MRKQCATSQKVAGSIPDGVTRIFHWRNPSDRTVALGSTQPLTQMSTRIISWRIKSAGALGWQPYHLHVPTVMKSGSLKLLEHSEPVRACNEIALPLPYYNTAWCGCDTCGICFLYRRLSLWIVSRTWLSLSMTLRSQLPCAHSDTHSWNKPRHLPPHHFKFTERDHPPQPTSDKVQPQLQVRSRVQKFPAWPAF